MRFTLTLGEEVMARLKERSEESGASVAELVRRSVEECLGGPVVGKSSKSGPKVVSKSLGPVLQPVAKEVAKEVAKVKKFRPAPRCLHPNFACADQGKALCGACVEYNAVEEGRCEPPEESHES